MRKVRIGLWWARLIVSLLALLLLGVYALDAKVNGDPKAPVSTTVSVVPCPAGYRAPCSMVGTP